jgi:hypothetical protein
MLAGCGQGVRPRHSPPERSATGRLAGTETGRIDIVVNKKAGPPHDELLAPPRALVLPLLQHVSLAPASSATGRRTTRDRLRVEALEDRITPVHDLGLFELEDFPARFLVSNEQLCGRYHDDVSITLRTDCGDPLFGYS